MLSIKYQSSNPFSFREEEFWSWFSLFLCSNLWPPGQGQFWPHKHHITKLGRGPQGLNTKYQSSMPSSSEEKNFEDEILCSYVPIFSFSHDVFKSSISQRHDNQGLFSKGLRNGIRPWKSRQNCSEKDKFLFTRPGFFSGLGEDTQRPSKGEKCTTKAIFEEIFCECCFTSFLIGRHEPNK